MRHDPPLGMTSTRWQYTQASPAAMSPMCAWNRTVRAIRGGSRFDCIISHRWEIPLRGFARL